MRKNFIGNLVFLLFLNLLVKPFWILGIDRTVQNTVGAADYGIYFALFNFSFLFQVVLDFGFNNFNNRYIAQDPTRIRVYFSTTLIAKLIFVIAYVLLVFIAAFGIGFSDYQIKILCLLILMQVLLSFYAFLRSNVAAMQLFKTDAVLSVLDKLITSALCIVLIWGSIPGYAINIENFIAAQIVGYSISCLIALMIVFRYAAGIKLHFDFFLVKEIIRKSFPYALLGFLMTAYYRVDAVMIERMSGESGSTEAGIYASAFRLLDSLSILGYLFAGILLPLFAKMISAKEHIHSLLLLSFKLMLLLSTSAGLAVLFYREEIMRLLYITGDTYSAGILGLLMVSFICISIIYVFGSLLTAGGNIKMLNIISIAGLIINVALNLILIPQQKALGAAAATVATQIVVLVAHVIVVNKNFGLALKDKNWLYAVIYFVFAVLLNLLIFNLPLNWWVRFIISVCTALLLAIPSKLFTIREIRAELGVLLKRNTE